MENAVALGAIIGIINGAKLAMLEDKTSFIYFCIAIVIGIVFGVFKVYGLDLESGLLTALASSGLYTVAKRAGGI
jgi:hypothetical protein